MEDLSLTRTSKPLILRSLQLEVSVNSLADTRLSAKEGHLEWTDTTAERWAQDWPEASSIFMIPKPIKKEWTRSCPASTFLKVRVVSFQERSSTITSRPPILWSCSKISLRFRTERVQEDGRSKDYQDDPGWDPRVRQDKYEPLAHVLHSTEGVRVSQRSKLKVINHRHVSEIAWRRQLIIIFNL